MSPFPISMRSLLLSNLIRLKNKFQNDFSVQNTFRVCLERQKTPLYSGNKGCNTELWAYTTVGKVVLREWRSRKLLLKVRSLEKLTQTTSSFFSFFLKGKCVFLHCIFLYILLEVSLFSFSFFFFGGGSCVIVCFIPPFFSVFYYSTCRFHRFLSISIFLWKQISLLCLF